MVTKAYLKEQYGNSQIINIIIDSYDEENGEIVDMSAHLLGEIKPLAEDEIREMIRIDVEALITDLKNKIYPVAKNEYKGSGFSLESI